MEVVEKSTTINDLVDTLLQHDIISEIEMQHNFSDGMYSRSSIMKAGMLGVGHIHKQDCINILSVGAVVLKTSMEDVGVVIKAPHIWEGKAGGQKIIYALTDACLTNVFKTDVTKVEDVYEELFVPDERSWLYAQNKLLENGGKVWQVG